MNFDQSSAIVFFLIGTDDMLSTFLKKKNKQGSLMLSLPQACVPEFFFKKGLGTLGHSSLRA
jgi:hypothetical protein